MTKRIKNGLFITLEGIDGCGKSTQTALLDQYLKEEGYETIVTLEPGGSEIGKFLRKVLLNYEGPIDDTCELFLYLADRAQHIEQVVKPALKMGKAVICDRHIDSTMAYQGYARGGILEQIETLNNIATKNLKPNLTLVFDVDVMTAQKRIVRTKDRLEQEAFEFHTAVREGYLELAQKNPERIKVIDASMEVDEVFEEAKKLVDELL